MSISVSRFELALKELKSSDWERFERLCSTFIASDFPGLRTMASPGGDRGRDAELYSIEGEPNTLFQYSVRSCWEKKIKETLAQVGKEFSGTRVLVFMTNQLIGAKADKIRKAARIQGVSLDIYDRSWFLERMDLDTSRSKAAAELARVIVDPLLEEKGIASVAVGLKAQEAKTALIFLELQARDDNTNKGITKSCFESLVKAALQGTTSAKLMSRKEIHDRIGALLPQHDQNQLTHFIDAAIRRLERSTIKHHQKDDKFHIGADEAEITKDRIADLAILQGEFNSDVHDIVHLALNDDYNEINKAQLLIRQVIETYFYRLGEEFAQSVAGGREIPLHTDTLRNIVIDLAPSGKVGNKMLWADFLCSSVATLLASPSEKTTEFFQVLSTAYTLFAFLSEVPDVQRATKKLFDHGSLWFDTTVLLPLIAEQAFPDDMRPFSDLASQLRRTGLNLWVTTGVIEEIERHLNLCKAYLRTDNWNGRVPYVYQRYALAGGLPSRFGGWLEHFVGDHRPLEDLADFLADTAGIHVAELPSWEALPQGVIDEIRNYWQLVQDKRRRNTDSSILSLRLAEHDIENYVSVIAQRQADRGKSIMGYTSWLVTMDSAAWRLKDNVSHDTAEFICHSPTISLDFLLRILSFGPRRDKVDTSKNGYTRIFASTIYESTPAELIAVAQQVRESCHGLSERLVQRRIRDALDKQRMKAGVVQTSGLEGVDAAISSLF